MAVHEDGMPNVNEPRVPGLCKSRLDDRHGALC